MNSSTKSLWIQENENAKPSEDEKKTITRHLTIQTGITINQFSQLVSAPFSLTWSGGLFNGLRSNQTWEKQSVFALDFDDGKITIDEVFTRLSEVGIVPQIWYSTFSDSPEHRKFRVVIFLDSPVTDISIHKLIHESLFSLFPEVDNVCKDASRYFFGGKNCTIVHTDKVSTSSFIDALAIQMYSKDSKSFRKVPLDSSYYSGLSSAQKSTFLYNIYRNDQISADLPPHPTSVQGPKKVKIDFDFARKKVRILDEFLNGMWLYHQQLFGLATKPYLY